MFAVTPSTEAIRRESLKSVAILYTMKQQIDEAVVAKDDRSTQGAELFSDREIALRLGKLVVLIRFHFFNSLLLNCCQS